ALEDYQKGIKAPYGLIFITGPTGSGKSTTLYTTLAKLKSPAKNLLTIEDPRGEAAPGRGRYASGGGGPE
ncbi:MAG: ATPase, T2SS/T4P/T4SS family, partial [Gemmatimonadota bacterium]